jgi:hypothetical protein
MKNCFLILLLVAAAANAFVVRAPTIPALRTVSVCQAALVDLETIADIGYTTTVAKPLGVVFGENRAPFSGLSVDVVEDGLNGGVAGLRIGDQLLAVDGESVIGSDFDAAMTKLKNSPSPMELKLYRGTISSLFTIIMNRRGDDYVEEADDEAEEVIFDENYESPVQVSINDFEDDNSSIREIAGDAAKTIGKIFGGGEKKGGFFGGMFSKETIQLDGDDGK